MKIEYTTKIVNGRFSAEVQEKLSSDLNILEGKDITLCVEPITKHRSDRQSRYYWGCLVEHQRACFKERYGELFSKADVHEFNKSNFLTREIYDPYINEVIVFPKSSTEFSTMEFEEKLEMIRRYFEQKFNWYIPAPNEPKLVFTNDEILKEHESKQGNEL